MSEDLQELVHHAQPDVSARRLARIYGEALLNAAERENAGQDVMDELHELTADLSRRESFVREFFISGVIGKERRELALKNAFENRSHPLVVNFLLVLNDHDRLQLFRTAVEEMQKLDDLRRRRFKVLVRSVVPLEDEQRKHLEDNLRIAFRLEPMLEQRIEPDLLGGMIVRVGDWVLDGSVRTQLVNLRKQLREMSSHEIQSRRDSFSAAEGN